MKIAIIGAGNVGATLGVRWASTGHVVRFGVRDPQADKVRKVLADAGSNASADTVEGACRDAEVVVLATPWTSTEAVIKAAGDLEGKIVIDCTNPLEPDLGGLTVGHTSSAGEHVAGWAAGAKVVKAFNSTGSGNMADPVYQSGAVTMLICGDDAEAKSIVGGLAAELGFDVCDSGPLTMSRYLEPLAMLWIALAIQQGMGFDFGFRLIKR